LDYSTSHPNQSHTLHARTGANTRWSGVLTKRARGTRFRDGTRSHSRRETRASKKQPPRHHFDFSFCEQSTLHFASTIQCKTKFWPQLFEYLSEYLELRYQLILFADRYQQNLGAVEVSVPALPPAHGHPTYSVAYVIMHVWRMEGVAASAVTCEAPKHA